MTHVIRNTLWLGFFGGILAAWVVLYQMAAGMGLDWIGRMAMPMDMEMSEPMDMGGMDAPAESTTEGMGGMEMPVLEEGAQQPADAMGMGEDAPMTTAMDDMAMDDMAMDGMDMSAMTRFVPLFGMWSLMMAAMMLPTLVPTLVTYERLMVSADGTRAGWLGVIAGYAVVWVGMAAALAVIQLGLLRVGIIDVMGVPSALWMSGALLILVGGYQFTRAKKVCHGVCHAPMNYFLGHWKTGFGGGLRMGLGLGAFCAGCCWGFMALGFVGGMMSLLWMGLATLFMVIEKLPEIGHHVTRPLGVALILGGLGVFAYPLFAG